MNERKTPLKLLSIIIPCLNEEDSIAEIIARCQAADTLGLDIEILVVDDGSQDRSPNIVKDLEEKDPQIRLVRQARNFGKGAAIRRGFSLAMGDLMLVQDADLEYDPADYPLLLEPLVQGAADVVYGSRFRGDQPRRLVYYWNGVANRILTGLSNAMTNINFSDMECGYKVFHRDVLERITLCENRFGIEPEITAKICRLRPKLRIYEVGIRFWGRTYEEGKKIGFMDGIRALYCIIRYNLFT